MHFRVLCTKTPATWTFSSCQHQPMPCSGSSNWTFSPAQDCTYRLFFTAHHPSRCASYLHVFLRRTAIDLSANKHSSPTILTTVEIYILHSVSMQTATWATIRPKCLDQIIESRVAVWPGIKWIWRSASHIAEFLFVQIFDLRGEGLVWISKCLRARKEATRRSWSEKEKFQRV